MASEVEICNLALGWLGQDRITSLNDPVKEAELCKINYPLLRDAVLEEGWWQFAFKQAKLPKLVVGPVAHAGNYFQVPPDHIRILRCDDGSGDYRIMWNREADKVRAITDILYIDYIFRVVDTSKFSQGFTQALAGRIAAELAMPITNSADMQTAMWKLYGAKVASGLNLDNMQGRQQRIRSDTLVRRR